MNRGQQESKMVMVSQKVFQLLLNAYPKDYREEFGREMAQVFQDQCKDAWSEARWRGLVALWLRVLPDLVKTSVMEHFAAIKGKKLMTLKTTVFLAVSVLVFLLVMSTATIVTLILPKVYASKARIKLQNNAAGVYDPYFVQTEFEVIQSEKILDPVIDRLDLNTKWGRKFLVEGKLKTAESRAILKARLELRPERNTSLIDITAYSDDKEEASEIANAVAKVYLDRRYDREEKLIKESILSRAKEMNEAPAWPIMDRPYEIIDTATPSSRPVRPNVPLNLFLGAVIGTFAALAVGGVTALLVGKLFRKKPAAV